MATTSANSATNPDTAIALNRFGLGARPGEPLPADARRYLLDQLGQYQPKSEAWAALRTSASALAAGFEDQRNMRGKGEQERRDAQQARRRAAREEYVAAVQARAQSALVTPTPFVERLVHFWANHFAISVEKDAITGVAGAFEMEAIRPNVLGRFEDLLLAVERHPAMLLYLDQARSIGPTSVVGLRASKNAARKPEIATARRGLNENLAREALELHTLGVRSGYTQADVTELAQALTGWSIAEAEPGAGSFQFQPTFHEPGKRTVLGRRYAASAMATGDVNGDAQAAAILRDIAATPATARHISTKLARHFVGDAPADALVERLSVTFMRTRGDLSAMYRVLIDSPEAWMPQPSKFKTPWDWLLSSLRALGRSDLQGLQIAGVMTQLGQPVWRPGSPAGWDDIAASWAAPDALVRRVEYAQRLAARAGNSVDPRTLAPAVLPASLSEATLSAISRAESGASGLALLLVSPDFLRR